MKRKRRELTEGEKRAASKLRAIWERQRVALDLTQEKLGELCGWDSGQSAVSQYLNGFVPLNFEAVLRFARVLRVNPAEIMPEISDWLPKAYRDAPMEDENIRMFQELPAESRAAVCAVIRQIHQHQRAA